MQLPIKVSDTMTGATGPGAVIESRIIRVTPDCLELFDIEIGNFISVRTNDGKLISLIIQRAYEKDENNLEITAYVTKDTYDLIAITDSNCDIEPVTGITLGCDPELVLFDRDAGGLVTASEFIKSYRYGPVGYDGLLLELRPPPSVGERVVCEGLRKLIVKADNMIKKSNSGFSDVTMLGLSSFYGRRAALIGGTVKYNKVDISAGFHLHFGVPQVLLMKQHRRVAKRITTVLDYYVGIPAVVPEGSHDSRRRTAVWSAYGKPGEFRADNNVTIEYRVPGAALMKHPILANGLLALGAVVVGDVISRIRSVTDNFTRMHEVYNEEDIHALYPDIPPVIDIFRAICSPDTGIAESYIKTIVSGIESMIGYGERAESITAFFNNLKTEFSIEVLPNWGLQGV
jgi:hypothetical protein